MVDKRKYGVVYTPDKLARFTAELVCEQYETENDEVLTILDPACGESALLFALKDKLGCNNKYIGIDIDEETITINELKHGKQVEYFRGDFLIQSNEKDTFNFWKKKLGSIDCMIANPPWSCERLYSKQDLLDAGYTLAEGQYDNYFLFIEQSLRILETGGIAAFILPDSIFSEDAINLRKMLCEKTQILVIARLGEKIFPNVNRATTIIVIKNQLPTDATRTRCFRLGTEERKQFLNNEIELLECYLSNVHNVRQKRFLESENYIFNIDLYENEEQLIEKIETDKIEWKRKFIFGRGVEISKSGETVVCNHCNFAQGYSKKQKNDGKKLCTNCGNIINFNQSKIIKIIFEEKVDGTEKIYVGENLHRYRISGYRYLNLGIQGINYKDKALYIPPKILIRKTGLGINAFLDNESTYISQTVYSCQFISKEIKDPIEYYLAQLNSRVIYFYYLKRYGENEWKSHPYLTKNIVFSLPLKKYTKSKLSDEICQLAIKLQTSYDRHTDLKLEKKIFELFELTEDEIKTVMDEINKLPNLSSVNNMKCNKDELKNV